MPWKNHFVVRISAFMDKSIVKRLTSHCPGVGRGFNELNIQHDHYTTPRLLSQLLFCRKGIMASLKAASLSYLDSNPWTNIHHAL